MSAENRKQAIPPSSNSFIENKRVAEGNKAKWNNQVDTILQRGDNYIQKPKVMQRSTLNYFERIKEKVKEKERETKVRHVTTTSSSNLFQESKPSIKLKKKKTFENDYKNKTTLPKKEKQIRVYPELLKSNDTLKGLLRIQERGINPYENYPNHFRPRVSATNPSDELIKMNTKKQLLPCDQGQYASHRMNQREYSNTHSRLFNNNDEDFKANCNGEGGLGRKNSTPRIRYIHKIELKDKMDHINNLISYHYGPKFKDELITDKPNRSNFKNIVSKTIENLKEDYVAQVC